MKKRFFVFVTVILCFMCLSAYSADDSSINVMYHGKLIEFDAEPYFLNGRIMVPIRAIFESMGASVEWDETSDTAISQLGDKTVSLTLNKTVMYINGLAFEMDVPVEMHADRIFASARFVAQSFDKRICYHDASRTAIISDVNEYTFFENISKPVPDFAWVSDSSFVSAEKAFNGGTEYTYTCNENGLTDYLNYLQLDFGYDVYNMEYLDNSVRYTYILDGLKVSAAEITDDSPVCTIELIPDVDMMYTADLPSVSDDTAPAVSGADYDGIDYGTVTGSELVEVYTDDGMEYYVYEYSPIAVAMYESHIESQGWVFFDFNMDIDSFSNIKYWKKGESVLCITTNPFYNIVMVAIE